VSNPIKDELQLSASWAERYKKAIAKAEELEKRRLGARASSEESRTDSEH
jgi:hypothetical protein